MFHYTSLHWKENQTPFSPKFQDPYFSKQGGLQESEYVFLQGNQLAKRWSERACAEFFTIVELGFGTALNFLATWHLWRQSSPRPKVLHYLSAEAYPLDPNHMAQALSPYIKDAPQIKELWQNLKAALPKPLPGFHRLRFDTDQVVLTLLYGEATHTLAQLQTSVDAWFLDGFAPQKNPALWSQDVLNQVARLSKERSTLATYTAAGQVRRTLENVGFQIEKRPGFGKKRECIRGTFQKSPPQKLTNAAYKQEKSAIIVGAGLAGCTLAHALVKRGWQVALIERHPEIASGASGGQAGILFPYLSVDWDLKSEFYWSGLFFTQRLIESLLRLGHDIPTETKDMVILPRAYQEDERYQKLAQNLDPDHVWLRFLSAKELSQIVGLKATRPGLHFKSSRWVHPKALCQALIAEAKREAKTQNLFRLLNTSEVLDFQRHDGLWQVSTAQQKNLTQAPALILANSTDLNHFPLTKHVELQKIRGQSTHLPKSFLPKRPNLLLNYGGYLIPLPDGSYEMGASFERDDETKEISSKSHCSNLQLFTEAFPEAKVSQEVLAHPEKLPGRVAWRAVRKNRWPWIGPFSPKHPGLYLHSAHGSKGLLSCPLGSEYLASYLNGEPLPLTQNLTQRLVANP